MRIPAHLLLGPPADRISTCARKSCVVASPRTTVRMPAQRKGAPRRSDRQRLPTVCAHTSRALHCVQSAAQRRAAQRSAARGRAGPRLLHLRELEAQNFLRAEGDGDGHMRAEVVEQAHVRQVLVWAPPIPEPRHVRHQRRVLLRGLLRTGHLRRDARRCARRQSTARIRCCVVNSGSAQQSSQAAPPTTPRERRAPFARGYRCIAYRCIGREG